MLTSKEIIKQKIHQLLEKLNVNETYWMKNNNNNKNLPFGVNIYGYITSENSIGDVARCLINNLQETEIPFVVNNDIDTPSRKNDKRYSNLIKDDNPYLINLLVINADMFPHTVQKLGENYFKNRYTIGFWSWELSNFPIKFDNAIELVDEIWCPSLFNQNSVAKAVNCPTLTVNHSIKLLNYDLYDRSHFNIPQNFFVLLFMFDFNSNFEIKNPLTLINAIDKAFSHDDEVMLVIKCSNIDSDKDNFKILEDEIRKVNSRNNFSVRKKQIKLIPSYLLRAKVNSLINGHSSASKAVGQT